MFLQNNNLYFVHSINVTNSVALLLFFHFPFAVAHTFLQVEAADMAFEGDTQILVTVQRADPEVSTTKARFPVVNGTHLDINKNKIASG